MAVLYFFSEPQTIYDCSAFICHMQFWLCSNGFYRWRGTQFKASTATRLYSLIYGLGVIVGLAYAVQRKLIDPTEWERLIENVDNLSLFIVFLEFFLSAGLFATMVVVMQCHAQRHIRIYDRLHDLDQRLIQHFGANLNYRNLKRKNIGVMTLALLLYSVPIMVVSTQLANDGDGDLPWMLLGAWCYLNITGASHVSIYVHMNLTELLRVRFRLLQKIIDPQFLTNRFHREAVREKRLLDAIQMIKELHSLIDDINRVYAITTLAALAHDFTLTTSELYTILSRAIDHSGNYKVLGFVTFGMLAPLYKMIMAPIYCHLAIKESQKCLHIIEQADSWYPESSKIRSEVHSVLMALTTYKPKFVCGLNITIDRTSITTVTTVIFNFLLILIQFHMIQDLFRYLEIQKNSFVDWIGAELE